MNKIYSTWLAAILILPTIALIQGQMGSSPKSQPYILKGKVTDEQTGKPVAGVHVFVVEGEEEGFSNERGEFVVKTWSALPVVLTIKSAQFPLKRITVRNARAALDIKLKPEKLAIVSLP